MSNNPNLLTISEVATLAAESFMNELVFANLVSRTYENKMLTGKKKGDYIDVRLPAEYESFDGPTLRQQDSFEGSARLQINFDRNVGLHFTHEDLKLDVDSFQERFITPAARTLANNFDSFIAQQMYLNAYHFEGTPGSIPNSLTAVTNCKTRLDNAGMSRDLVAVFDNATYYSLTNTVVGLNPFSSSKALDALEQNRLGMLGGFDTYQSSLIRRHTSSTPAAAGTISGANQSVTYASVKDNNYQQTLVTTGITANAVIRRGDVFRIAGVNSVNPITQEDTGQQQTFVVMQDVTANGTTTSTTGVIISPPIITTGAHRTVTTTATNGAALTWLTGTAGTAYSQNLLFNKNAVQIAMVPFDEVPNMAGASPVVNRNINGFSVTVGQQYDIINRKEIWRLDAVAAVKVVRPQGVCRLTA